MKNKNLIKKRLSVAVAFLFITLSAIPSTGIIVEQYNRPPTSSKTLYVGGNGPGNYTKIQDAIDNASDGDTVFVFDDLSPYYENVVVDKSIDLIGENNDNTVVDGSRLGDVVNVYSSDVILNGFTVRNSGQGGWDHGISVSEEKNIQISDCIITGNSGGIRFNSVSDSLILNCSIYNNSWCSIGIYLNSKNIAVKNCTISNNGAEGGYPGGICILGVVELGYRCLNILISDCSISNNICYGLRIEGNSRNIEIHHNNIFENTIHGISVFDSDVNIYSNHIFDNGMGEFLSGGIYIQDCINCVTIKENDIASNNPYGIFILRSSVNSFIKNNFINNEWNAFFSDFSFLNHWNRNYWTDWLGFGPKLIRGTIGTFSIPWINIDWHPVKEPYNIR